jgi:outer membrane protein assembly factor BamB
MVRLLSTLTAVAYLLGATLLPARAVNWPVFGYDPARTGFNSAEHTLTVRNVRRLRERWQLSFGGGAAEDSTPIFLERVRVGRHYEPMLFATTTNGTTYGIEATTGQILWKFATHGPRSTTATPAADPSGLAIYVPGVDGKVHKLDAANGQELHTAGFPVRITRMPSTEADDAPLNVANGYLYATLSAYNDQDELPYAGHVVGVNLSSGQTTVFNAMCSDKRGLPGPHSCPQQRSGIWGRGGVAVDPDSSMSGRIYFATGNGDFDANAGGHDYGDSVISISEDLSSLLGTYTPSDYKQLENGDVDLGSTSPGLLPAQPSSQTPWMLVQGGKDAVLRLLNRAALPGPMAGGELQTIDLPAGLFSAPAVWTDPMNDAWVFLGLPTEVEAYRLQTNGSGISQLVGMWRNSAGSTSEGTSPVVANGIVFVAFDGAIVALNASTGTELWSSAMPSAGKTIGAVHWENPIVVDGWVYCSDHNRNLTAYALP